MTPLIIQGQFYTMQNLQFPKPVTGHELFFLLLTANQLQVVSTLLVWKIWPVQASLDIFQKNKLQRISLQVLQICYKGGQDWGILSISFGPVCLSERKGGSEKAEVKSKSYKITFSHLLQSICFTCAADLSCRPLKKYSRPNFTSCFT